jgi:glutamate:GABA antiporter
LVLAQLLYITIPEFFGTAAKAVTFSRRTLDSGDRDIFYSGSPVVAHLNRLMPLEGGLYEWARLAFGDGVGFLVAWNLWLYSVIYMALAGLITTSFVAYAIGQSAVWISETKWLVLTASFVLIVGMIFPARAGFALAKWVTNVGAVVTLLTLTVLLIAPLFQVGNGTAARFNPLHLATPPLTVFTLSVFSKMTFGALCGYEYMAIFAAKGRHPERNLVRSVIFTAPIIALIYILGTSSILYFSSPDTVDVVAAIPQALTRTFYSFGSAKAIVPLSIFLLLVNYFATFNINFNVSSRLPMVAGSARKDLGIRPAIWLRAAAVSGFLVTLLYIMLSIFPIIDVQDAVSIRSKPQV